MGKLPKHGMAWHGRSSVPSDRTTTPSRAQEYCWVIRLRAQKQAESNNLMPVSAGAPTNFLHQRESYRPTPRANHRAFSLSGSPHQIPGRAALSGMRSSFRPPPFSISFVLMRRRYDRCAAEVAPWCGEPAMAHSTLWPTALVLVLWAIICQILGRKDWMSEAK